MYKTILFDLDGTLVPSLELWLEGFRYALKKVGKSVPDETIIKRFFYRDFADVAKEFDLGPPDVFSRWLDEGLALSYHSPILFPHVREVLEHCVNRAITVGLVTSASKAIAEQALTSLNIRHHFSTVVTADDITNYKPHPEPVLKALQNLNAQAEETLFVGDYTVDIVAGRAAGTHTALFHTEDHGKFYDLGHLKTSNPHFVFSSYQDLLHHLTNRVSSNAGDK